MVTLDEQVHALVAQASPSTVPSGVLVWFGTTDFPDGIDPAPLGPAAWLGTYLRLLGGDLDHRLPSPVAMQARAAQPGAPVPIAIAVVDFHRPLAAVVAAVLEAGKRGTSADLPAALADAIEPATAVIATPMLAAQWHRTVPTHRGRSVQLTLDPALLVSNVGDGALTDVAVDAGSGWTDLAPGGTITVQVTPSVDSLTMSVRCRSSAGEHLAACTLAISDDPVPPAPDETWQLTPPTGNAGHAYVFRAGSGPTMQRPILIAEGWPGGASAAMLAEAVGQNGLVDRWRANGHDVVMVGFANGLDSIQSNAGVITAAIRACGARTTDRLVVGGMSMGGLVARYALLQMEHAGVDHGAAVYLSLDSPHGAGAYTTVAGQWMVNHLTALSPAYQGLHPLIFSPSNLQFIGLIEQDGTVGPHPLRTQLLAEFAAMGGMPRRPVRLAIACGRGSGGAGTAPTDPIMSWQCPGIADVTLRPMPAGGSVTLAEGSTLGVAGPPPPPLVVSSEVCWEVVPGALNVLNEEVTVVVESLGFQPSTTLGVSSAVPTVSALDAALDPNAPIPPPGSGVSPFDDYLCAATDVAHLQFSPEQVDWLVDRIESHQPLPAPPSKGPAMTTSPPVAPVFNPNDPGFIADPYPTFAWFRDNAPVTVQELVPGVPQTAATWVFRDEDVRSVLTGTDTYVKHIPTAPTNPPTVPSPFGLLGVLPPGLLSSDPPRHDAIRAAVEPGFLEAMAQAATFAETAVAAQLEQLAATRRFELVQQYALPVPSSVLLQVLGLPAAHLPIVENWVQAIATSHNITMPVGVQMAGGVCAMAMRTYYDALVQLYQGTTAPGMLGNVCPHIGKDLQLHDVQVVMSDMLVAGYLTTTYLISTGIRELLRNPDQLQKLRDDPTLLPSTVEEMLRFNAPAQMLDRLVAVPTTLGGVALTPGTHVIAVVGSANRDAARYPNPDVFDITRQDTTQIAFGDGIHTCIGAPLARIVAPIAIKGLLSLDGLRLDGDAQWQPDPYLRGLVNLPVAYGD